MLVLQQLLTFLKRAVPLTNGSWFLHYLLCCGLFFEIESSTVHFVLAFLLQINVVVIVASTQRHRRNRCERRRLNGPPIEYFVLDRSNGEQRTPVEISRFGRPSHLLADCALQDLRVDASVHQLFCRRKYVNIIV